MEATYDVIVVGDGAAPAAVLDALAARGHCVVLVGGPVADPRGHPGRLQVWDDDWRLARLAAESAPAFRALACPFEPAPALTVLRRPDLGELRQHVGGLNLRGADLAIVPPRGLRRSFPERSSARDEWGVFEAAAGRVCRAAARTAWMARARTHGPEIRCADLSGGAFREGGVEVRIRDRCVTGVRAGRLRFHASRVVLVGAPLVDSERAEGGAPGRIEFARRAAGLLLVSGGDDVLFRIAPAVARRVALRLDGVR